MAIQTFTSGQVLTAAQQNALQANDYNQTVSTKTASYTLVAADKGTRVVMNSASATTITVNTSLFSAGDTLVLQNIGAGVCTVTAGTATVSSAGPLAIPQYGSGTLYFTSASAAIFLPSAGPAATSGLTLVTTQTASGVGFTLTNCFSATYTHYMVWINQLSTGSASGEVRVRLGSSGSHQYNALEAGTGATFGVSGSSAGANFFKLAGGAAAPVDAEIFFNSPFVAVPTHFVGFSVSSAENVDVRGKETTSTSFTDLTFSCANAVAWNGGTIKVYGYTAS